MPLLPPCKEHTEQIAALQNNMASLVSMMAALVEALKDSHANITGLQELQAIKDTQYTPGEIDQDHTYFR